MLGIVKLICALTAVGFPMAAGALAMATKPIDVLIVVCAVGAGSGLLGVFGFAAIERTEDARLQVRRVYTRRVSSLLDGES